MKDLRELFDQRDKTHLDKTNEIAAEIQHVFHGIIEFINQNDEKIEWVGLGFNKEDDVIIFNFQVHDAPGEVSVSSVGIPLDIVAKGTKEDVVSFLVNTNREEKKKLEEAEEAARKKFTTRVKQIIEEEEGGVVMIPINKQSGDDEELTGTDILQIYNKNNRTLH